ncbi:MAG: N-acetyltransferase [Bacteroidales bacterium]|nr:N-acetyltransferase [Bacteroidales bacterium]
MEIREVTTRKEKRLFVQFPKRLYKDCPYYVPTLERGELVEMYHHPALQFCDVKYWLCYDGGEVVGRVAGIVNRKCNELKGQRRVRFGWLDFIDNPEVARRLLKTVEEWGKSQGMTEICGPSRFSNMQRQAMLVDGFDQLPCITGDYNFPYYPATLEKELHFEKEVDYIQYKVPVGEVPERFDRLCKLVKEKYHVRLKPSRSKSELRVNGKKFFQLLNRSYVNIYNFIPLTDEEIDWEINNNFIIADLDLVSLIVDEHDEPVGLAMCLPSLSKAFQKANGKLLPFGWWHILRARRKNDKVDMFLTGVAPEYLNSGIHVLYHKQLHETFLKKGYQYAIASQQLEDNPAALVWKKYGGEVVIRRRCYHKDIE